MKYVALLSLWSVLAMTAMDSAAEDDEFGRLFTTAAERARLDSLRNQAKLNQASIAQPVLGSGTASSEEVLDSVLRFSGIVVRPDGSQWAWINNQLAPVTELVKESSGELKIPFRRQRQLQLLKPGQVWADDAAKPSEAYELKPSTAAVETTVDDERLENELEAE